MSVLVRRVAALVLLAAVAGCTAGQATGSGRADSQVYATITATAWAAPTATTGPGTAVFVPATFTCRPLLPPQLTGRWQTMAPRGSVSAGPISGDPAGLSGVPLGLRDATGGSPGPVEAVIYRGGVLVGRATGVLRGTNWLRLSFPGRFQPRVAVLRAGVYTVIWRRPPDVFIACDGFAAR